jgi:Ca2+-transporting ATPase
MKNKKQLSEILWHNISADETEKLLNSDRRKGLKDKEISSRREEYGENKISKAKKFSMLKIFLSQFNSPLIYILIIATIITFVMKEYTDSLVIFVSVFINALFGFVEEMKVSRVFDKLSSALKTTATVIREGKKKEIFQEELVVGDLIILKAGDKVPADGRVVGSENLQISEAVLTGESRASQKEVRKISKDTSLADRENMVYMGSLVESGKGSFLVTSVGKASEVGNIADMLREAKELKSPLQIKIATLGKFIGLVILILVGILFLGGLIRGDSYLETFQAAIAIAVGGIPESLPIVVTVVLAIGMERLLRKQGLVRKMNSVETLGSASIICLDKTKTLTQGKMEISELVSDDKKLAIKIGVICNEAYTENSTGKPDDWSLKGSPTDKALFLMGEKEDIFKTSFKDQYQELNKYSFDFHHKIQASLIKENDKFFIYVTGAPEKVIERVKNKDNWQEKSEKLAEKGLRVIALAYKEIKEVPQNPKELLRECEKMKLVGLAGFKDPLRIGIREAIEKSHKAGIEPIIITGDQMKTALFIAQEAGIQVNANQVLEGRDLDAMSDSQLRKTVHNFRIYVRAEPRHKIRIVSAWQKNGKVVAMVGDGVNDAPAIKQADIGIAVGSGTEIAKQASDLILINDSFDIIVDAVAEGRTILSNLRKSIAYVLSDSFASIIVVGVARVVFGWPLPILPVQILWNNLIEDAFPTIAYAFEPPEKGIMKRKPEDFKAKLLTKEMKVLIFLVGVVKQFIILFIFWILFMKLNWNLDYVRTLMFGFFALDTAFIIYSFKDLSRNIWQIDLLNNKWLNLASIFVILAFLATIYIPFLQVLIKTVPIDFKGWLILMGVIILNIFLVELTKFIFIVKRKNRK